MTEQSIEQPLESMSREELEAELTNWRNLWTYIPEDERIMLSRIGQSFRLVLRNYHGYFGDFIGFRSSVSHYEVRVFDRVYEPSESKYYFEAKIMLVPTSAVNHIEFVNWREMDNDPYGENLVSPALLQSESEQTLEQGMEEFYNGNSQDNSGSES